mgnify:CR=1 FL=1
MKGTRYANGERRPYLRLFQATQAPVHYASVHTEEPMCGMRSATGWYRTSCQPRRSKICGLCCVTRAYAKMRGWIPERSTREKRIDQIKAQEWEAWYQYQAHGWAR